MRCQVKKTLTVQLLPESPLTHQVVHNRILLDALGAHSNSNEACKTHGTISQLLHVAGPSSLISPDRREPPLRQQIPSAREVLLACLSPHGLSRPLSNRLQCAIHLNVAAKVVEHAVDEGSPKEGIFALPQREHLCIQVQQDERIPWYPRNKRLQCHMKC